MELIQGGKTDLTEVECAGAVILVGRGQVVLVRPLNGRLEWVLPKGHVEKDETHLQCAIREAMEETGATIKISDPPIHVTHHDDLTNKEAKTTTWFIGQALALKTEKAERVLTDRGHIKRDIAIYPLAVALARLTHEEHRDVLAIVLGGSLEE